MTATKSTWEIESTHGKSCEECRGHADFAVSMARCSGSRGARSGDGTCGARVSRIHEEVEG